MTFEEIKSLDEQYVMHSYSRFPVAVDRGKGAVLWDMDGREYIDFTSGIGVTSLGHGDEGWLKAVTGQAAKLGHISNLFYTEPYARAARALCQGAGMSNAMFANSGAEANEAMIKLARKWSFDKYGKGRGTVITLHNSFHGRTITTLAATGQDKFHDYFFPFTEGFRYADANDMDSLEAVAGHDVCAVMLELVQGEGGVLPLDQDFVRKTADLCAKRDWLLLIDEVQTGVGRTGTLFAFQQYGLAPDVVSFAKGIAGGLPFGGVMANERCRDVFAPGTHGTTFGGNPIAAAAACHVLERMDEAFLAQVRKKGDYLRAQVEELSLPCLGGTRGLGLMIGVEVKAGWTNRELAARLIENGLLVLTAGPGLRFLPPLTITREEMDRGLAILKETLR
ncbi:MAG: aspartate aminotransferase family protein [Lawsonibacter sp.]|nr:aspartate aminotransferase family protein [Lawsonibacter sp.]